MPTAESFEFRIHRFKQVDSTNDVAFRFADEGAPAGSVFVAEYQTKGRGKWGRHWVSPRGRNLLFSLLLRPEVKAAKASLVTQIACRSVARVLTEKCRLHPSFKRPNDILVGGKKVCGVLVESKGRASGQIECLVVGIGLNVNSRAGELVPGATSLAEATGRGHSRQKLLKALLAALRKDLEGW